MAESDRNLRASNAERERVIDALREHTAEGRLTMQEFEERVEEALAARTRGDLEPVLRELPPLEGEGERQRAGGWGSRREGERQRAGGWGSRGEGERRRRGPQITPSHVAFVALAAVAVLLITQGMWWLLFPLFWISGGFGLCRGSRNRAEWVHNASDVRGCGLGRPQRRDTRERELVA